MKDLKIYAKTIEPEALAQIERMAELENREEESHEPTA